MTDAEARADHEAAMAEWSAKYPGAASGPPMVLHPQEWVRVGREFLSAGYPVSLTRRIPTN